MDYQPTVLVFAGSARKESLNKKLAAEAARAAEAAGAKTTFIDLRDYPMPLYDGDLEDEKGLPEKAHALRELFFQHDGLIIASPEYNGSVTPLLKNTIGWLSRKQGGEAPLACFAGKTAALVSASPGALGGLRALAHLRQILSGMQVLVLPEQKAYPNAGDAFDDVGRLKAAKDREALENIANRLARVLAGLHGGG